ncbi:MoaD family protein [Ignisphaera aggregans DSM 17230]|uniref:MoaD family protein n=1 Tax=Ignisphaera aggregans (strain DSM 17230 / JCM 13409 / AQ1.S1) TaxID=583356 RepID=E0SRF3_IGNAA|nr:MoaD family protein [Ignisphaera aggregans DSM 17230]
MKIRVRLFSIYRDVVGREQIEIEVSSGISVNEIINYLMDMYPKLKSVFSEIKPLVLINGAIVDENNIVDSDAEIAIIPPVSGGMDNRIKTGLFLNDTDIDVDKEVKELITATEGEGIGAITIFIGVVKDYVENAKVNELIYEVYEPYASRYLEKIAREEIERGRIKAIRIFHRVGSAKPGEKTLFIAVAGTNRKESISALEEVLERVKHEVPIFKLERREDGEYWIVGDGRRVKRV